MRREPRRGADFIEQLVLPVVNIVFLLVPVLLVVIELTSLAALQASTPDAAPSAQAPATWSRDPAPAPLERVSPATAPTAEPVVPDPMIGYGF
ncbi:hypothetical protein [Enhygromyxa salina]|nr:hypothetical protein [Enhygromyxa salina]